VNSEFAVYNSLFIHGRHHHGQHRFHEKLVVMEDCQVVLCRGMGNPAYEKLNHHQQPAPPP
jgi:predicted Fe-Mo cluster-binding NifX family protein